MTNKDTAKLEPAQRQKLSAILFQNNAESAVLNTYAIIDAAKESAIPYFLDGLKAEFANLLQSEGEADLASAAPYLVRLESDSGTDRWYAEKLYGNSAGFVFKSERSFQDLSRFWSSKVREKVPNTEEKGIFRFYDPRVLRDYLSILEEDDELEEFLQMVELLAVESNKIENILIYKRDSGDETFKASLVELSDEEDKVA